MEWIDINTEPAPTNRRILVANDVASMEVRCTWNDKGQIIYRPVGAQEDDATFQIGVVGVKHWMDMPAPPVVSSHGG